MTSAALSDSGAVVLALCAAGGAFVHRPVPLPLAVTVLVGAFVLRRPVLLCIGTALLTSVMGARCWAGLVPSAPRTVQGVATLVSDPAPVGNALHVELRLGHARVDAWARGTAAAALAHRLAGERVEVEGRLGPLRPDLRGRLAVRHIAAQLSVKRVGAWQHGGPADVVANGLRRTLEGGTSSLPSQQRALFTGFVLGDSRGQSAATADDFRNAGLTHLLVVSGENVAFVLAVAGPLLRMLGLRGRFVAGLLVLVAFGVLVRWEPSVLRAEAMAALALFATTMGRPVSGLRLLALAVTALLVIDPVLVHSVGFLLSVGACAGIALWAAPLAARLPGPRIVAEPLAVTVAAQIGVAPVLIPVFGALPVAAIPANLLAIPAAGPLTMWGMTAGVVAGLARGPVAAALHVPTRLLVAWIASVAHVAARLPLGHVGLPLLVVFLAGALAYRCAGGEVGSVGPAGVSGGRSPKRATVAVLLAVTGLAALSVPALLAITHPASDVDGRHVTAAARVWRHGHATVLVLERVPPPGLPGALRRAGVRHVDVLAVTKADSQMGHALDDLLPALRPGVILSPPGFHRPHLVVAVPGTHVTVGGLLVEATGEDPVRFSITSR